MRKSFASAIPGLIIIITGAGFLLDTLNIIEFSDLLSTWWPTLLIIIGLISLSSNPSSPTWPLLIVASGILLQLRSLEVIDFDVWNLIWPLALIVVGISLLPLNRKRSGGKVTESTTNTTAMFSGVETSSAATDYEGGSITAMFGGVDLDLRKAKLKNDATLEVFVVFGGIELKVPEGWRVDNASMPIFGGVDDNTTSPDSDKAPTLTIRGTCLFGGIEIKN